MNRFTTSGDERDGCGFLEATEVELCVTGELDPVRHEAFERHARDGCGPCALLAADLEIFHASFQVGETDRAEFDRRTPMLIARLQAEVRKRSVQPSTQSAPRWSWAAAAVLAVVAIGTTWLQLGDPAYSISLPGGGSLTVEKMAFSAPPTVRGEVSAGDLWEKAERAYEQGRYERAAGLLGRVDPGDPSAMDAATYRGVSFLLMDEPASAVESLKRARALAVADDLPTGGIDWYLGLSQVRLGETDRARDTLRRSTEAGGLYAERASALLERLAP